MTMQLWTSGSTAKALAGSSAALVPVVTATSAVSRLDPVRPVEPAERLQPRFASSRQPRAHGGDERDRRLATNQDQPSPRDQGPRLAPQRRTPYGGVALPFLAQLLNQGQGADVLVSSGDRDAPRRGSEAYRAAGAEPPTYSQAPAVFRLTV